MTGFDHHACIRTESERFRSALGAADPSARVPTCPDWSAADLLWHLAEVQLFWTEIVRDRLSDPEVAEAAKPGRPDDYPALLTLGENATTGLLAALEGAGDDEAIWTWAADESVGFVRRFQVHEATMHRVDADMVSGHAVTPIDAAVAADGVDVALRNCFVGPPAWAEYEQLGFGRLEATDTGASWLVELGTISGTSPNTGRTYDKGPLFSVVAAGDPSFAISGGADDLDRWVWGRGPADALTVSGDAATHATFAGLIAEGVQ
jgi:uncharacterized protein (TIGR03083 family)